MGMGNYFGKADARARDARLFAEFGDLAGLGTCDYDEFAITLRQGEEGLDQGFNLKVQEKWSDSVTLIVEHDSVIRVSLHATNARNQILGFLYQNQEPQGSSRQASPSLLASSIGSPTGSSLFYLARKSERGYQLKLEYADLDESDPCPLVYTRVIVQPISDMI